jgi:hypothetical protein
LRGIKIFLNAPATAVRNDAKNAVFDFIWIVLGE